MGDIAYQKCINPKCSATFDVKEVHAKCPQCGDLLDVLYDWERVKLPGRLADFERRWTTRRDRLDYSGVWRFRELIPFAKPEQVVTVGEGQTSLLNSPGVADYVGLKAKDVFLQYEGLNPSGSFKDNGMTGAFTHARITGAKVAACASTGNTSASLALFASQSGLVRGVVFVGGGKIAYGKLAQSLEYGALTLQIEGDFDDAMKRVQEVCAERNVYLVNSLNPFRLEGQKAIMFRVLEGLNWEVPDWIVVPGGNLGNSSAFGKAFAELKMLGLVKRVPRLAVINATGARTLCRLVCEKGLKWNGGKVDEDVIRQDYEMMDRLNMRAHTVASAIEINRPVNLKKCLRALEVMDGVVREVSDEAILDAKARVGANGLGCEPASAASVAGVRALVAEGVISPGERVVCILTGHVLKDPHTSVDYHSLTPEEFNGKHAEYGVKKLGFQNKPISVPNNLEAILKVLEESQ